MQVQTLPSGSAQFAVVKRSISFGGVKTSVSLEDDFWDGLGQIARNRGQSVSNVIAIVDGDRTTANLSSALRLFVLNYYRASPRMIGGPSRVNG